MRTLSCRQGLCKTSQLVKGSLSPISTKDTVPPHPGAAVLPFFLSYGSETSYELHIWRQGLGWSLERGLEDSLLLRRLLQQLLLPDTQSPWNHMQILLSVGFSFPICKPRTSSVCHFHSPWRSLNTSNS